MDVRYFKRVFYRTAGSIITTATKGGTYPDYTLSGWTPLPGNVVAALANPDKDKEEPADGGSTDRVVSEKVLSEITVTDFDATDFATIRGLMNQKLDIMLLDPDNPGIGFAAFGVRVYPKPEFQSAETPKIVITGERRHGADIATKPFQLVTVNE
ncbi:MAG: hypothetical protein PHC50_04385 [Candidatus Cloacimonetes bacterium]|nr:hypothetical protein [Candidatus Cloacimonadota bacterium]